MKYAIAIVSMLAIMSGSARAESGERCMVQAGAILEDFVKSEIHTIDALHAFDKKLKAVEAVCPNESYVKIDRELLNSALDRLPKSRPSSE
jgi:hypothetical protein